MDRRKAHRCSEELRARPDNTESREGAVGCTISQAAALFRSAAGQRQEGNPRERVALVWLSYGLAVVACRSGTESDLCLAGVGVGFFGLLSTEASGCCAVMLRSFSFSGVIGSSS